MENSQSLQDEVCANIRSGNFSRALQNCLEWLSILPPSLAFSSNSLDQEIPLPADDEYRKAGEAFFYCRFFLHRQERLGQITPGAEKARLFLNFFGEIENLAQEKNFVEASPIFAALSFYMHGQIVDGLAKAFAGQKAYDLNQEEILQLARSLLFIENQSAALETLKFLCRYNNKNPEVLLLLSFAHWHLQDIDEFEEHFREALFLKPEILQNYVDVIPVGDFSRLWEKLQESGYPSNLIYRVYALLAEVNGLYKKARVLSSYEIEKLEDDFQKLQQLYYNHTAQSEEVAPRLMHLLCRILLHFYSQGEKEKTESYGIIFETLDANMWESFQENVLRALPPQ